MSMARENRVALNIKSTNTHSHRQQAQYSHIAFYIINTAAGDFSVANPMKFDKHEPIRQKYLKSL
jgi:hypothetical protein